MPGLSDLKLEFRDAAAAVEARLLQGDLAGAWRERVGWRKVEPAGLAAGAKQVRADPDTVLDHGGNLWSALHDDLSTELARFAVQGDVRRLILATPGATLRVGTENVAAQDVQAWVWEALHDPTSSESHGGSSFNPLLLGAWTLLRRTQRTDGPDVRAAELGPLRVMLLLTSVEHTDPAKRNALRAAAARALRETRRQLSGLEGVHCSVAASSAYATREANDSTRGTITSFDGAAPIQVDEIFGSDAFLEALLRNGTLAPRTARAPVPVHVLVTFGHSDAQGDALASGLEFVFAGEEPQTIPGARLADWLRSQQSNLRLIAALNCASVGLIGNLLGCAPHVLATHVVVDAGTQANALRELIRALEGGKSVGESLTEARAAISPNGWQLVHFATTIDDTPFLSESRRGYYDHLAQLYQDEGQHVLGHGAHLRAPLKHVYVRMSVVKRETEDEAAGARRVGRGSGQLHPEHLAPTSPIPFARLLARDGDAWILRGDAGGGKTTSLRWFLLSRAPDRIPIYASLPLRLAAGLPPGASKAAFLRWLGDFSVAGLTRVLTDQSEGEGIALLLDGFDELATDPTREEALRLAKAVRGFWPRAIVVLAARKTADLQGLEADGWPTAILQPLDVRQQRRLLFRWFYAGQGPSLATARACWRRAEKWQRDLAAKSERIREMAANPFMLTFFADLILTHEEDRRAPDPFDRGRHALLQKMVSHILERRYRWGVTGGRPLRGTAAVRRVMGWVAWRMLAAPTRTITMSEFTAWLAGSPHEDVDRPTTDIQDLHQAATTAMDSGALPKLLAEALLQPEDPAVAHVLKFSHNLLQEGLAAEHWWSRLRDQPVGTRATAALANLDALVKAMGMDKAMDFWTEPTALLAGWMQDDGLLVPLINKPETLALGLRVMQALDTVNPETWAAVLRALPAWQFDIHRAMRDEKGPRVLAYEAIAAKRYDSAGLARLLKVLAERAGAP